MASDTWRAAATPLIAKALRRFPRGTDLATVKKAISAAYPYGARENWPYQVWRSETKRQLRRWQGLPEPGRKRPHVDVTDPRQETLVLSPPSGK